VKLCDCTGWRPSEDNEYTCVCGHGMYCHPSVWDNEVARTTKLGACRVPKLGLLRSCASALRRFLRAMTLDG
jgi:hypothetical protein